MARVEGLVGFGQDLLVRDAPAVPAPATVVRQAHRIRRSSTCAVARETTSIAHGVSWGIRLAKSVLGVTLPQTRGQLPLQVARAPIASRVARVGAGVARTWPGLASSMSGTPTPGMGSLRSRQSRMFCGAGPGPAFSPSRTLSGRPESCMTGWCAAQTSLAIRGNSVSGLVRAGVRQSLPSRVPPLNIDLCPSAQGAGGSLNSRGCGCRPSGPPLSGEA